MRGKTENSFNFIFLKLYFLFQKLQTTMQTSTIVVLACLVAVVVAQAHQEAQPANTVHDADFDTPAHESSPRNKRGLLLLKKKLILGKFTAVCQNDA